MTKRVLTVGLTYTGEPIYIQANPFTGEPIVGVEIENFGLCHSGVDQDRAAFPLYE